jgi:lyso-ornithine lipid O-acyltransferase
MSRDRLPFVDTVKTLAELAALFALRPPAQAQGLLTEAERSRQDAQRLRAQALRLQDLCARVCQLHGWQPCLSGQLPSAPAVLVANHQSYIDPLILCAVSACIPLAKQEVSRWPLIGNATQSLGVQFMRRGDAGAGAAALKRAAAILAAGVSVLNFPEGTTTSGLPRPFRAGVFGVAQHAAVPVVPIAVSFDNPGLHWVGDQSLLPHYLRALFARRSQVKLCVGPRLWPSDYRSPKECAEAARQWISARLAEQGLPQPAQAEALAAQ